DLLNDTEINNTLEIISIETDNTTALPVLQNYAVEHEITWYLAIAPVNMTSEYGVTTLPTFVIINPYGNITFNQDGVKSYDTLKTEILKALKGASGVELTSYLGFTIGLAVIVAIRVSCYSSYHFLFFTLFLPSSSRVYSSYCRCCI
ncbi:MAG: TlpA family protein disulfide reductase, partial [Candidatus Heimdallarchaeaceae archaeon]